MAEERKLAIDVVYLGVADPGDGVPGTVFTQLPTIEDGSIEYDSSDPQKVEFKKYGSDKPWAILMKAGEADTLKFNIPSPTMEERLLLMGGKVTGKKWDKPNTTPTIRKTVKIMTKPYDGKQLEYIFVNCDIFAKITDISGSETTEIMQVQCTILAAVTAAGVENASMTVEQKDAA
nr:MAG TPA: hypothetical protein [Caudoviricetes sp.]